MATTITSNPIIAKTDGQALILKRIKLADGQLYDIRVSCWDANKTQMNFLEGTPFLTTSLAEIAEYAKQIFGQIEKQTEVWYTQQANRCFLMKGKVRREVYKNTSIFQASQAIHSKLSLPDMQVELGGPASITHLSLDIPPSLPKRKEPSRRSSPASPELKKASPSSPSVVEIATNTDFPLETYEGITLKQLAAYSQTREKEKEEKLEKIYQDYLSLLTNPNAVGYEEMRAWLEKLYRETYQKNHNEFLAAQRVAFIKAPGKDTTHLVNYLINNVKLDT